MITAPSSFPEGAEGRRHAGPRALLAGALLLSAASCGPKGPASSAPPATGPFHQFFTLVAQIPLEEPGDSVLSDIGIFRERPGGGFLVADRYAPVLRVHDARGNLVKILGGGGREPGRFVSVSGVAETPAGIYVSDSDQGRITRFTHDLALDRTYVVGGHPRSLECCAGGDMLLLAPEMAPEDQTSRGRFSGAPLLHLVDEGLEVHATFMRQDTLVTKTPYWAGFSGVQTAVLGDEILAADDFLYPIHVFDRAGRHIRELGTPPKSWRRAALLSRGELMGANMVDRTQAWLADFTVIDHLGVYRDSLVVVTHARNTPSAANLVERSDYGIDVYAADGTKLLEDIPVPGRVVGVGRYVYVVQTGPPEPWLIGAYEVTKE